MNNLISSQSIRLYPSYRFGPMALAWVTVCAAILFTGAGIWIKNQQQQLMGHFTEEQTLLRHARTDLTKGYLHVYLATSSHSPFDRTEGLALLDQAQATFDWALHLHDEFNANRLPLENASPYRPLAEYGQALAQFRHLLVNRNSASADALRQETALRILFFDLERRADMIEANIQENHVRHIHRYDGYYKVLLWGSVAGLAAICLAAFASGIARKQTDSTLNLWAKTFEYGGVGLAIVDAKSNVFLAVNPQFAKARGYSPQELVGQPIALLYPDEQQVGLQQLLGGMDAIPHCVFETEHVCKDGKRIPVLIDLTVIKSAAGHAVNRVVYAIDISERKASEQALLENENRFRALVEQSLAGIYIIQNDHFCYVNPRFAAIFGYPSPESLTGHIPVMDLVSPEDREQVQGNIQQRLENKVSDIHCSFKGLHHHGELLYIEAHGRAFDYQGQPAIIGFILDVTARRLAEERVNRIQERLQLTLDATKDSLFDWDLASGLMYWSPRYYEMAGYQKEQTLPDLEFFKSTVYPDDWPQVWAAIDTHLQEKTSASEFDYRLITASGDIKWVAGRGRVVQRDASGAPLRMVGTISDISFRKQTEETLYRQTEELVQRNAELERFNDAMIGRELDMIALKQQINALSVQLKSPPPFNLAFMDEAALGLNEDGS